MRLMRYSSQFMKMIVESVEDLNATDHQGNTFLHIVISDVVEEINHIDISYHSQMTTQINIAVETAKVLLENGAYSHARNKQGRCPFDLLQCIRAKKSGPESILEHFRERFKKYDSSLTLKYLAARTIVDSQVPYANRLPKALVRFVDLH